MDVLGSTDQVELNLFRTQLDEERQTRALASGLRVVSASDDPSGLAISENIQTKVLGLQQGIQNVQTAGNLLSVADGVMDRIQQILSRIHTLIVEAGNDLNSNAQDTSIQTEIDSLLQEINKISSTAKFNGVTLFDGSLSNYVSNFATVAEVSAPALPDGSAPTGTQVVNWDGASGQPGILITNETSPSQTNLPIADTTNSVSSYITFRVIGYSANAVDPDTGANVGAGDYVQMVAYSANSGLGAAPEWIDTQAIAVNSGLAYSGTITTPGGDNLLDITIANLTAQDVGTAVAFEISAPNTLSGTQGTPLQVNTTGEEGGNVNVALPSVSVSALNLSNISVMPTSYINYQNTVVGTDGNQYAVDDAEARVQAAIDTISEARAQIGAQAVALQDDASNGAINVVNLQASESAIRDVNIGEAVTQFTKDQVMSQVGMSVLAQMHSNAQLVIQLVGGLNPGGRGKV